MNKKFAVILSIILNVLLTILTISEVQAMTQGLSSKQDKIVTIAAFTANGNQQKLKTALDEGLDTGLTINEIKEVLVQMYAYVGFPRSLNGINTFMSVLEERERKGIKDIPGKEPGPMSAGKSSVELGTEIQTRLIGAPATGKYVTFAPAIDAFLKGHLFGDIFGRDNLDFQSREIATISALACIDGVNPQLQSHFNVGLNVGLTESQLHSLINVLEITVGRKEAANANKVLSDVLGLRQTGRRISITRSGSLASSQGAADYFTGSVNIQMLFNAHDPSRTTGGVVTFQPGARTAWHSHPCGQTLIVTAGAGRLQQWGGPVVEFKQGDVVWIPPGVKHWHGAAPNSIMTHVAIQESLDGKTADWKERVSEEQYLTDSAPK